MGKLRGPPTGRWEWPRGFSLLRKEEVASVIAGWRPSSEAE